MDLEEEKVEELLPGQTAFDNFDIKAQEVSAQKSVSIFKLLSNRYLTQYSKLIKRREDISETKGP
jgi:hypothetical protein